MAEYLRYELDRDVAYLTMDDGRLNLMTVEMMRRIDRALDAAAQEAKIVVLRSALPKVFSAGFDLKVVTAADAEGSLAMLRTGAELILKLMSFPLPTVGVMAGHAFPMGTFLLLACDLRFCARGPYRMGLNEVAIGIVPPGFAIELARSRLHPAWLSRTVTLGEMYEPEAAVQAGFLDHVVAPEILEDAVAERIEKMKNEIDFPSHTAAKRQLRRSAIAAVQRAIETELTIDVFRQQAGQKARER